MNLQRLNPLSDFAEISRLITASEWDELSAHSPLSETALADIANNPAYFFLMARTGGKITGTALAVVLLKTDGSKWLYVDELDVHPQFRRQGIASALMGELFSYAKKEGIEEAWLGADNGNRLANSFYESFAPAEKEGFTGYTFDLNH